MAQASARRGATTIVARAASGPRDRVGLETRATVPVASYVPCLLSGAEQAFGVSMTSRPRLIYLASSFPYGKNDTFFGPEVRELVRQGVDLLAIPVRPRGDLTTEDAAGLTLRKPLL